ncbi:adenosine kinase [Deltaproteobacteria bacterium TL4]
MKNMDVYGIGNPLIDLLAHVSDDFLVENEIQKDRMYLVEEARQKELIQRLMAQKCEIITAPGGSCANTIIGISQLGGKTSFSGKIGNDEYGKIYQEKLEASGVNNCLGVIKGTTGSSLVLVSEDGARTMNTYLGSCQSLHYMDIKEEMIKTSKYLYLTGYLWDTETQKKTVEFALNKAKPYNTKVAMSLSDAFCVERHKQDFINLLKKHVDLVFCNLDEATHITGTSVAQEAVDVLGKDVETVVLTMGGRGALIAHKGRTLYIDPVPVDVLDTTGAGDAFAAGFLYGITQGRPHLECGRMAAFLASEVISRMGPRSQDNVKEKFKKVFESLKLR